MKLRIVVISLFTAFIFFACRAQYISQGNKDINHLQNDLKQAYAKFSSLDTALLINQWVEYQETISLLKKAIIEDTEGEDWEIMTFYSTFRKPLRNMVRNINYFEREFKYSFSQLENLKFDLSKKYITEEQYKEYIEKERFAINELIISFNQHYESLLPYLNEIETAQKKINELLKELEFYDNQ